MSQLKVTTFFLNCVFLYLNVLQGQAILSADNYNVTLTSSDAQDGLAYAVLGRGAIRMDCLVANVKSRSQLTWQFYHNSKLLDATTIDFNIMVINRQSLFIHNIQRSVSGNYTCCVNVQQQTHQSNSITVLVFELPVVSLLSRDKLIKPLGSNVIISANVSGDDLMWHAVWHINNNQLWSSSVQLDFKMKQLWRVDLTIPHLQYTDQGVYRLAVTNGHTLPVYSSDMELAAQGPPETPSSLTVETVPQRNGTSSRLLVRWKTPPSPMHHRKYDTPANTFRISYQALDHEWEERQVEGTEEVMLTDLMPCTVFNIKVAGCNLIGCSPASQTVQQQTLVSPESAWLKDNLYLDKQSGKLLLRNKQEVREVCVPLSSSLKAWPQLCTHLLLHEANHPGVFSVDFQCQHGVTDLTQCSFQCPLPSRNCGPGEETIKLCDERLISDVDTTLATKAVRPTGETSGETSHNISPVVLVLSVVCSVLGTLVMIGLICYVYHRRYHSHPNEEQRDMGNVQGIGSNSSLLASNLAESGRPPTPQSPEKDLDDNASRQIWTKV